MSPQLKAYFNLVLNLSSLITIKPFKLDSSIKIGLETLR